ncbi:MAG: hypothetical protein ACAI44_07725 [Candidatus Sericytochromatia bacterium]
MTDGTKSKSENQLDSGQAIVFPTRQATAGSMLDSQLPPLSAERVLPLELMIGIDNLLARLKTLDQTQQQASATYFARRMAAESPEQLDAVHGILIEKVSAFERRGITRLLPGESQPETEQDLRLDYGLWMDLLHAVNAVRDARLLTQTGLQAVSSDRQSSAKENV